MGDDIAIRLQKVADAHCAGLNIPHDLGLKLVAELFASDGREEERWCEDVENSCTCCGGSGHRDDMRTSAALADAQAVGFAAGVEAAAKRVGFTECPACGGEGWEIYDHEEHDCQTCFGRGVVPHLDKSALTPPDLTAAAARVLLGVWPTDDSFRAAFDACAARYHGGDQMQDEMDRTRATVSAALRAIAGDTP